MSSKSKSADSSASRKKASGTRSRIPRRASPSSTSPESSEKRSSKGSSGPAQTSQTSRSSVSSTGSAKRSTLAQASVTAALKPTKSQTRNLALVEAALARWADPVVWAEDVLGVRLWRGQKRLLRAVARNARTAIRSGHKCGKSTALAIIALWWWCTKRRARVIITAPSYRQVEGVIWKEIRRLYKASKFPLGGDLHKKPESGLQAADGREIIGFSTDEPERMAGFSGPNMLFLVDEASGVDRRIFEAIDGNRAGGAHVALISNPTQSSGVFYDAFHGEGSEWHCEHISSVECAKYASVDLGESDTGLATSAWCSERLRDWGPDDPRYHVRVLGNFPTTADDTLISLSIVTAAEKRWHESPPDDYAPLQVGVDVARFGRDKSVIVWSRGLWASPPTALSGNDNVQVAGKVLEVIRLVRRDGEPVRVCIDTTNNGGVADILRASEIEGLEIVDVQYAANATVEGFSRLRDQIWCGLRAWLKEGGAIPDNKSLRADVTAPKYGFDLRGRIKVEGKDDLKKRLGRSPDFADALGLATFRDGSGSPGLFEVVDP